VSEFLTGDELLADSDLTIEFVTTPSGKKVGIRSMALGDLDSYDRSMLNISGDKVTRNLDDGRAKLLVRTLCNEKGERLLTDAQAADLSKKAAPWLNEAIDIARRLNGLTKGAVADAKKNSEAAPDSSSDTDTP
jgi:hypothetical protein